MTGGADPDVPAQVAPTEPSQHVGDRSRNGAAASDALPIRMLHDRVLVSTDTESGERRSGGGILIPATVQLGRRMAWGRVVAIGANGANVRSVGLDDRVLFDPEDRAEVEVRTKTYLLLRERDLHAVAERNPADGQTGLYL